MSWAKGLRSGFTRGNHPRRWAQVMLVGVGFVRLYWDDRFVGTSGNRAPHRAFHIRVGDRIIFVKWY